MNAFIDEFVANLSSSITFINTSPNGYLSGQKGYWKCFDKADDIEAASGPTFPLWWRHVMETLSTLPLLLGGNHQAALRTSYAELWHFICYSLVQLRMIWDTMMLMLRHCNGKRIEYVINDVSNDASMIAYYTPPRLVYSWDYSENAYCITTI